ncbi:DUF7527 domain-containing protein [Natronocalculus amylovorans]|uniref:DUF7527 domain-containing protein n=1 Tax=Natronocalculus amylovorans TaxID=2917812 RepID=A0AAE3FXF7_9EURY|nr:hypothetical protein [Natronocalculus amylovorans]MCL9817352.1 hypothetical protein [Natronocalculus amylovorans]
MEREIVETITEWEPVPFGGGYDGLHSLAESRFSGAISSGSTWAFMLNGKLIGVVDGTVASFEDGSGTAYEAPDTALPLLFAMQTADREKKGQYYTNDTPLSSVDETLSSGGFTGYIELSENVLSGDYYIVYYGGKPMSVAFVGNSRQLLTEDEAFNRADDEVGIYTVHSADISIIEIPGDSGTNEATARGVASKTEAKETERHPTEDDTTAQTGADEQSAPTDGETETNTETDTDTEADTTTAAQDEPTETTTVTSSAVDSVSEAEPPSKKGPDSNVPHIDNQSQEQTDAAPESHTDTTKQRAESTDRQQSSNADVFSKEAKWRETRSIPSLDPSESATVVEPKGQEEESKETEHTPPTDSTRQANRRPQNKTATQSKSRSNAEQQLQRAKKLYKQLQQKGKRLEAERDSARKERDAAEKKVKQLEQELEELRSKLESQQVSEAPSAPQAREPLAASEALSGTNLFVRYESKGATTLEKVAEKQGSKQELIDNLRLEKHTSFDRENISVNGHAYDTFLKETIEYGFTKWVVEDLLFEIIDTGNENGLRDVFAAVPKIDRAEFKGVVELESDEEDDPLTATFDVVLRDRMGVPLLVANFNDTRDPARSGMIESLVRSGSDLTGLHENFGGVIAVTASFFDPSALEAAGGATGGGLLSRSKGKSYVKVGRKQGFHLCLVESREGDFHMSVPEL